MMRGRVPRGRAAALGKHAVAGVAAQLEGRDAGDIRRESQHLKIEHQLDVFFPRVGHANRRGRQFSVGPCASVVFLDLLDAAFDLTDVFQVVVQTVAIFRIQLALQSWPCRAIMLSRMLRLILFRVARDPVACRRYRTIPRRRDADRASSAAVWSGEDQLIVSM